jgi:uncharacterized protein DUF1440
VQDIRRLEGSDACDVWKGLAAGLIGGLVASWTMNRFQDVWSRLNKGSGTCSGNEFKDVWSEFAGGVEGSPGKRGLHTDSRAEVQDDTTVRAASAVSEGLFGHNLTPSQKKFGGTAVHYLLGTGVGGLYGATAEIAPRVTAGVGLPFGAVFWLVVDEGAVPLLGLSKGPTAYPISTHAYALSSHFVYGVTAEVVRRAVRKAM